MRKCIFGFIAQFLNWIIWHFAIELYEFLVQFGIFYGLMVSDLMSKSLIHFDLIFVYSVR